MWRNKELHSSPKMVVPQNVEVILLPYDAADHPSYVLTKLYKRKILQFTNHTLFIRPHFSIHKCHHECRAHKPPQLFLSPQHDRVFEAFQ